MDIVQFPFRLLTIVFLLISLLGGIIIVINSRAWLASILIMLTIQTIFLSIPVTTFREPLYKQDIAYTVYGDVKAQLLLTNPADKNDVGLPSQLFYHSFEAGYLPKNVDKEEIKMDFNQTTLMKLVKMSLIKSATYTIPIAEKIMTRGKVSNVQETPNKIEFEYDADQTYPMLYKQLDFPGWVVRVNDIIIKHTTGDNGRIQFTLPSGHHHVSITYDQPVGAVVGRMLSLIAVLGLMMLYLIRKWLRRHNVLI
jgi:uncharacterized membrane protein YfhO